MDMARLAKSPAPSRHALHDQAKETLAEEAKTLILHLLPSEEHGLDPMVSRSWNSRLDQRFYFACLYKLRMSPTKPIKWPMVRMPHGPVIYQRTHLLKELLKERKITDRPWRVGPFTGTAYLATQHGLERMRTSLEQNCMVAEAIKFIQSTPWPAAAIQEYSHSWQTTPDGHFLDLSLDLLPDSEVDVVNDALATMPVIELAWLTPEVQVQEKSMQQAQKQVLAWIVTTVSVGDDLTLASLRHLQQLILWQLAKRHTMPCQTVFSKKRDQLVVPCYTRYKFEELLSELRRVQCSVEIYSTDSGILELARSKFMIHPQDIREKEWAAARDECIYHHPA